MQYIKGLKTYSDTRRSAVTFGKFDGLHRGHQKLVDKVKEFSEKDQVRSVVCAFDMAPMWEKKGIEPKLLMTKEERALHLADQVDYLVECPFTERFSQMEAEEFIEKVIKGVFHAAYVVVGTDFHFGHGKSGDIHMLEAYESKYDYELVVVEKERFEGKVISSTYIKELLEQGSIKLAGELLGYHYGLTGIVEPGKRLGRTLGFPTFNVAPGRRKMMPAKGVYLNRVLVDGTWYNGIANVGTKPTVSDENRTLAESFLFGYNGDAYGKEVAIELLEFRRPEQRFADVEEMKQKVNQDIQFGRQFFGIEE